MRYDATWRSLLLPERGETPVPGPNGWDRDSRCAELARLGYYRHEAGDKLRLDAALAALGFTPATGFCDRRSGTQAFATLDGQGTAYVVWRGTQVTSAIDVLVDLATWRVKWAGKARVHAGFRWAYRRLASEVAQWLAETPHRKLIVTGHSLGAALATLMAADRDEAELVTFGSPRVGNAAFSGLFTQRSALRYMTSCDNVAGVPWEWMGYRHTGEERYIDRTGKVHPVPPDSAFRRADQREAKRESWRTASLRRGELPSRPATDHAPINYISALLGIREG